MSSTPFLSKHDVIITLGAHAQRGFTVRVCVRVCVCVCVCLSVTLHITSRMFVRLTNDTTYLTGNEGQKYRTVFSENAPRALPPLYG